MLVTLLIFLQFSRHVFAAANVTYVEITNSQGKTEMVEDNRQPALYTGPFGDCLADSSVSISRFDVAYYADNLTVSLHIEGSTALVNESIMMYIGVYAYGENRFQKAFDPCSANIASLCPMQASVPITASGIIPLGPQDVASIPTIALTIPDFEGEAILRMFANSTESEIGCYSAVITNGASFSHPASVGTVLGLFTLFAMIVSFATAIYGDSVPVMRTHYAHSMSVLVVMSVFQHIFFTGAISMNWPSVLVAWWSNFAWAGGMIYSTSMQNSIDNLIGTNVGNTSELGAAASGTTQESLGGGYNLAAIYKRGVFADMFRAVDSVLYGESPGAANLTKRDIANASTGYYWYGPQITAGLPLPGNYSGFAGTLAQEDIAVSNAFLTGFLWFLILFVILVAAVVAFKWLLEGLVRSKALRSDRLTFFRSNWKTCTAVTALRTCSIAFFMLMFLTLFQFTYESPAAVRGIAAIIFILFLVGTIYCVFYAYYYRIKEAKKTSSTEPPAREEESEKTKGVQRIKNMLHRGHAPGSPPHKTGLNGTVQRMSRLGVEPQSIHEDDFYVTRFGWLTARFRRSRWWFFGAWLLYEFIRACFYGGASGHSLVQVFGLLIVEIIAFGLVVLARPFEGRRLNLLVVYMLGFSKVMTVALSSAFDVRFNLPRITTTIIGVVIIIIQGILTILTLVAIVIGAISSHMSLMRNKEDYRPRSLAKTRHKYFAHIDRSAREVVREKPAKPVMDTEPKDPYFEVGNVRRLNKIEDDDPDFAAETRMHPGSSHVSLAPSAPSPTTGHFAHGGETGSIHNRRSRATSVNSLSRQNLPFGARSHRLSWSSREFQDMQQADGADSEMPPLPSAAIAAIRSQSRVPSQASSAAPTPRPRSPLVESTPVDFAQPPKRTKSPFTRGGRTTPRDDNSLRAVASNETLRVPAAHDSIGAVPTPVIRPRSGTWSSRPASRTPSRAATPTQSVFNLDGNSEIKANTSSLEDRRGNHSRVPLTPAVEGDEDSFANLRLQSDKKPAPGSAV